MKKLLLMFAAAGVLFTACNKEPDCGHEFIEHDYTAEIVHNYSDISSSEGRTYSWFFWGVIILSRIIYTSDSQGVNICVTYM